MPSSSVRQNAVCAALDGGFNSALHLKFNQESVPSGALGGALSTAKTTMAWCKPFEIMGSRAQ